MPTGLNSSEAHAHRPIALPPASPAAPAPMLRRRDAARNDGSQVRSDVDTWAASPKGKAAPTRLAPLEPVAAADLMWCRLPGPEPLPTGVLTFGGRVSKATAVAFLSDKLFASPAFARQLATTQKGALAWQPVSQIDVEQHLQHHTLACSSQDPMCLEALTHWCQAPLRPGAPPWDMTLLDCRDRSLIFVRVHHAVTDGPGMMQALLSCHDDPGAWPRAEKYAKTMMARHARHVARTPTPNGALLRAAHALFAVIALGLQWCMMAAKIASAVVTIATRRADRKTVLKPSEPVAHWRYAVVPGRWSIDSMKRIAQQQGGGTVNDVLLTVFTGALREIMAQHGEPVDNLTVRAMQTVNLPHKPNTVGNNVGLAMADLPISAPTLHARFGQVRAAMRDFKRSVEPWVASRAMAIVARLPQAVIDFMHRRTTGQCSLLVSNVIGPMEPFVLDGQVVENMHWFSPRFGDLGVVFPVISYNGAVQATVQWDAALCEKLNLDPQQFAQRVQAHFEELVATRD